MAAQKKSSHTLSSEERNQMSESTYAFPEERKEPLNNASHVRNAIARFDQVKGVSAAEKKAALGKIKKAAKKFGVKMTPASASGLAKKGPAKKTAKIAAKK
jgi:L-lysine 2,3-aminomutase